MIRVKEPNSGDIYIECGCDLFTLY